MMIARVAGLEYGDFVHTFGDAHIYNNHMDQINLQLSREPKELPQMEINPNIKNIFDFNFKDFNLVDYKPHSHIKGKVSV
jgi:thymidylate synthase